MAIKIIKNTLTDPIYKTCEECGSEFTFNYDDIQSGSYIGVFGNTINYRFITCPVCKHRCSFKDIEDLESIKERMRTFIEKEDNK